MLEQADGRGGAMGMMESMKEHAKEVLAGHTGETNDKDN